MKELLKCTTCKHNHYFEDRIVKPHKVKGIVWDVPSCPKCVGKWTTVVKPKCYVIMVAKNYPKKHLREGEPTNFKEQILNGDKIHTIRQNYELWEKRIKKVQEGIAYLSLREWSDSPYKSKQVEVRQLHQEDGVGIIPVEKRNGGQIWHYCEDPTSFDFTPLKPLGDKNLTLAKNDGLEIEDFISWFENVEKNKPLALIYFSHFRY